MFINEENNTSKIVKDEIIKNLSKKEKEKEIRKCRSKMEKAAKTLDFVEAARLRDKIKLLRE